MYNKNKLIVSVDVEDWYHGPKVISPLDENKSLPNVLANNGNITDSTIAYVYQILDLFDELEIKATFFWVAEYAMRNQQVVKDICKRGHEIGCHGLEHYSKYQPKTKIHPFNKSDFLARTALAKQKLEEITGVKVIGYRAPNAYVSGEIIDWLEELGFTYDSSVSKNSIYNKTSSNLFGVSSSPYYPKASELIPGKERRKIIEFPWSYFNFGIKIQTSGGPFLRFLPEFIIKLGLNQSLNRGHTVFYFHPSDISDEKIKTKNLYLKFFWYFKGKKIKRKIKNLLFIKKNICCNFSQLLTEANEVVH